MVYTIGEVNITREDTRKTSTFKIEGKELVTMEIKKADKFINNLILTCIESTFFSKGMEE